MRDETVPTFDYQCTYFMRIEIRNKKTKYRLLNMFSSAIPRLKDWKSEQKHMEDPVCCLNQKL